MHYVNERSQIQKSIYCVIPFERTSGKGKSIDAEIGSVVAWGWGWYRGGEGRKINASQNSRRKLWG